MTGTTEEGYIYRQIAESLRQDILNNRLRPGDRLPTLRELMRARGCTQGTVQKAYSELSREGLIVSRPGQGTHVRATPLSGTGSTLRWASLLNRAEGFLLEVLTTGYTPEEAESAIRQALDRWRVISAEPSTAARGLLRFVGSHDPALSLLREFFALSCPDYEVQMSFAGSLGGLMALARNEADIAGSHLWDEGTDSYNAPFVSRLLPSRRVALLALAGRHLGLITAPGNPKGIESLEDLRRKDVRFLNRQRGSGTRVWLDNQLSRIGVEQSEITGYCDEIATHSELARQIATGRADVGLGVETVTHDNGLSFTLLTKERYDLVIPDESFETEPMRALSLWLQGDEAKAAIRALGGYDTEETGKIEWVNG